jgi:hypothetical protein
MANTFGTDILIQVTDPKKAALFYVEHLGFEIADDNPTMRDSSDRRYLGLVGSGEGLNPAAHC